MFPKNWFKITLFFLSVRKRKLVYVTRKIKLDINTIVNKVNNDIFILVLPKEKAKNAYSNNKIRKFNVQTIQRVNYHD